jgi:(R,R)-butanediol dehydrogenase/meso-butanediol dehydrogenase/diacetyl reductase
MKGIVFVGDREVEIRELAKPSPGAGEVLLAMKASGLCGSDFRAYRAPRAQRGDPTSLAAGGHEPCGVVAEVGSGVSTVRAGDRVMMHHYTGCGTCRMCRIGYTQMCLHHHEVYGFTQGGGHQDFLKVPASTCVPLPDALSFEEGAACACGTGTAFHALKRLGISGIDTIAIFGQGPVGLSATQFAATMGARVIAVDVIPERLELASQLGADRTIDAGAEPPVEAIRDLTHGDGADATLDATGIPQVRLNAVDSARSWGKVCFVGEGNTTTFDVSPQIIHKQLTIYGSWTFSLSGLAEVADFVVERRVPLKELITHRFTLDQAAEAYRLFDGGRTGKVVLVWP